MMMLMNMIMISGMMTRNTIRNHNHHCHDGDEWGVDYDDDDDDA